MAKLSGDEVQRRAKEIIRARPGGIRFAELVAVIEKEHPQTPHGTVTGNTWRLHEMFPSEVEKPSRGLFRSLVASPQGPPSPDQTTRSDTLREASFYEPFSTWLKEDLDEATEAYALGGNAMKSKWGTPDIIGVYKPAFNDLIKFEREIISVELKIDPSQSVVAFGQVASYRLFSSKCYIAMPDTIDEEDLARLESLSLLFGVGLVLFQLDPTNPDFKIRARAQRFAPDMFYVNQFARRLSASSPDIAGKLFG